MVTFIWCCGGKGWGKRGSRSRFYLSAVYGGGDSVLGCLSSSGYSKCLVCGDKGGKEADHCREEELKLHCAGRVV